MKNTKLIIVFVTLVIVVFSLAYSKVAVKDSCKNVSSSQAINIIKALPEVQDYLKGENRSIEEAGIIKNKNSWKIQVYELVTPKGSEVGMTNTFNWYGIDVCTGKLTCMESQLDQKKPSLPICND